MASESENKNAHSSNSSEGKGVKGEVARESVNRENALRVAVNRLDLVNLGRFRGSQSGAIFF